MEHVAQHSENPLEKTFAILSIKRLWHQLFDFAPACLKLSAYDDAKDIFEPFLKWAEENSLSMDWSLHLHFLQWLCEQEKWCARINDKIKKELLMAAAKRWLQSGMDHINVKGLILTSKYLSDIGIAIWKSKQADEMARVVVLSLRANLYPDKNAYAVTDIPWLDWPS
jgi:hypothetical protein